MARSTIIACVCSLTLAGFAFTQTDAPENAQSLLEKVKRRDLDRQMAAKQTELDRLAEDLAKGNKEAETMQANIDTTGNLLKESGTNLNRLISQRKRLEQVIELTTLRIEAEKLKAEGLQMLADAQAKSLAALTKRAEETDLRANLGATELKLLAPGAADAATDPAAKEASSKLRTGLAELRKKLLTGETSAVNAEKIARDAMRSASSKLELADIASVKAKRKAANVEGDLPEIAEKPLDLEEKAPDKTEKTEPPK
jgi:hypothetical protein